MLARKPYATPALITYGPVSELTGQRRLRSTVGNGAFDLAYSPWVTGAVTHRSRGWEALEPLGSWASRPRGPL